jgi:hypothetical protein
LLPANTVSSSRSTRLGGRIDSAPQSGVGDQIGGVLASRMSASRPSRVAWWPTITVESGSTLLP